MNGPSNPNDDRAARAATDERQAPPRPTAPGGYPAGYPQPGPIAPGLHPRDPRAKSPILACVLSIMPGLGQIYVGYYVRGFVHALAIALLFPLAIALDKPGTQELLPMAILFMVFFWFYNVIDAGRKAALFNQALAGGESIDLPSDFVMPQFHGSVGIGSLLIAGSFVLLLYTRFGVPLEWLKQWWPVLPMGFGVWLVVRAIQERSREDAG